jgi:hypothetical protein
MGEMCQAKDRRLRQDVAIRVLPEEFAKDAERVARFRREAKLPAFLNRYCYRLVLGIEGKGAGGVT